MFGSLNDEPQKLTGTGPVAESMSNLIASFKRGDDPDVMFKLGLHILTEHADQLDDDWTGLVARALSLSLASIVSGCISDEDRFFRKYDARSLDKPMKLAVACRLKHMMMEERSGKTTCEVHDFLLLYWYSQVIFRVEGASERFNEFLKFVGVAYLRLGDSGLEKDLKAIFHAKYGL